MNSVHVEAADDGILFQLDKRRAGTAKRVWSDTQRTIAKAPCVFTIARVMSQYQDVEADKERGALGLEISRQVGI